MKEGTRSSLSRNIGYFRASADNKNVVSSGGDYK
jgi:hypothetical protein